MKTAQHTRSSHGAVDQQQRDEKHPSASGRTAMNIEPREVIKVLNRQDQVHACRAHGIAGWLLDPERVRMSIS